MSKWNFLGPLYAALPELLAAQPDRAAEYDDAASATPTDAEILSSLRCLYASDAAAAMAAEDDVRTVRAFLARRKNYAFPPAPQLTDLHALAREVRGTYA